MHKNQLPLLRSPKKFLQQSYHLDQANMSLTDILWAFIWAFALTFGKVFLFITWNTRINPNNDPMLDFCRDLFLAFFQYLERNH